MNLIKLSLALSFSAVLLPMSAASALDAKTVSVACSPSKKLQQSIDSAAAGEATTFLVSGTCNENIVVSSGKIVTIRGANATAKITPANVALPAIVSYANTTIQDMTIQNARGSSYAVVVAERGSYLQISSSKLSGASAGRVVAYWNGSSGMISNSRMTAGIGSAVEVQDSGSVIILGNPTDTAGPDGFRTVLSSTSGWVVDCGLGSSVFMRATADGATGGGIEIKGGRGGVFGHECSAELDNQTNNLANFSITGASAEGGAIRTQKSSVNLKSVSIKDNQGWGIDIQQSTLQVDGTSFSKNVAGDIQSGYRSSLLFTGWYKKNIIPQAFTTKVMNCYPYQKSDIFIESSAILVPAGKNMNDLVANNPCVTVND